MTAPGDEPRRLLMDVLRHAYSGELAAERAYAGHAQSVSDPGEKREIEGIRQDELDHRQRVGEMLAELGGAPSRWMEIKFWWIGTLVAVSCRIGAVLGWLSGVGWFAGMWGAGKLERGNIVEYERAAVWALQCGRGEWVDELLHMAEVEWDHELYFRTKSEGHWLVKVVGVWPPAGRREAIRERYEAAVRGAVQGEGEGDTLAA